MKILGLTGSIGMGKTTTAQMFEALGVPVHASDAAVHGIYAGPQAHLIEDRFPGVLKNGAVDRAKLSTAVLGRPEALAALEAIVHPLVRAAEAEFVADAAREGHPLVVLDIPLLYETNRDRGVDAVLVVTAPASVQRERVLARPGMTPEKLDSILARQMPDAEKRRRGDFVIDTATGLEAVRDRVAEIVDEMAGTLRRG